MTFPYSPLPACTRSANQPPAIRRRLRSSVAVGTAAALFLAGTSAQAADGIPSWKSQAPLSFGEILPSMSRDISGTVTNPSAYGRGYQVQSQVGPTPLGWALIGGGVIGVAAALGVFGGDDKEDQALNFDNPDYDPGLPPESGLTPDEFETGEYARNWGLSAIHAASRYAEGGTGYGTILAIFDSGADWDHMDLAPNYRSDLSYSYWTQNNDVRDFNGHGTHVASIVGAAKNDSGMHGVAFQSDLMILQGLARGEEGEAQPALGTFARFADAQRRAYGAGARAINHSWTVLKGQDEESRYINEFNRQGLEAYLGGDLLSALSESAENDLVTVFAAANDGNSEVSVLAGIPVLIPELQSHWIAVTSIDQDGGISSFANRCGLAMDFCLAAPGGLIYGAASSDTGYDQDSYVTLSGTSMAAPHVEGAIGVLASEFPELTGDEIATILFDTAADAGAIGTDEIYGRGILDLENAIAPQGTISIASGKTRSDGYTAVDRSWVAGTAGIAGSLMQAVSGQSLMVSDIYERGYVADVSSFVATQNASAELRTRLETGAGRSVALDGATTLTMGGRGSVYGDLVDGQSVKIAQELGGLSYDVEGVLGDTSAGYFSAGATLSGAGGSVGIDVGHLSERGAMLGTAMTGAFGGNMASNTNFARLSASLDLGAGSLEVAASKGQTDFSSSGIFAGGSVSSEAISLGWSRDSLARSGDSFRLAVSSPLTLTGGKMRLDRPVSYAAAEGGMRQEAITRQSSEVSIDRTAAPIDIEVDYRSPLGAGALEAGAIYRVENGGGSRGFAARLGYAFRW